MKKNKIGSLVVIAITSIIGAVATAYMQEQEVKDRVREELQNQNNNEEEA